MSRACSNTTSRRRAATAWCALALATVLAATACQSTTPTAQAESTSGSSASPSTSSAPEVAAATVQITPKSGAKSVRLDAPVEVAASGGTLASVEVTNSKGDDVEGEFAADRTSWHSTQTLAPKATYTVKAVAENAAQQQTTKTSKIKTLTPKDSADYYLLPSGSGQVGVGMPVVVQFAGLVDADKQAAIEKKVTVTTSPKVDGAWGWLDARQLIWRPKAYWKPGTKVTVKADIAGIETRAGVWTARSAENSFTIGSAMISTVDVGRHTITVRRNGKVLRTMPVTTGKVGFATRNGVKVILSRESSRQMDAETTGLSKSDPEYYNINVKYAMRVTWSGEFLHAAPWSVGSQGRANVSHGCTGMSTANAKWLFDNSKMGDVVKYTGSKRSLEPYNGYTMWNMSLASWAKHSALA